MELKIYQSAAMPLPQWDSQLGEFVYPNDAKTYVSDSADKAIAYAASEYARIHKCDYQTALVKVAQQNPDAARAYIDEVKARTPRRT